MLGMTDHAHPFATLTPDFVLDALAALGLMGDGRLMTLNSYENRVYLAHLEPGTPLADSDPVDPLDFVRVIAVARITMPRARVRLSAGRQQLGEAVQALCFMAGANSIFYGDKLLVTGNPDVQADTELMRKLGLKGLEVAGG